MPKETHSIAGEDLMSLDDYAPVRKTMRTENVERKRARRLGVGPDAMVFFESYETMWMQIQEMLFIEKGGDAQLADELAAYNPMIPNGSELTATLMFEVPDETRRQTLLATLGGVEEHVHIEVDGERITAQAEEDIDRTTADGKASSVQFLHFPFTADQIAKFRDADVRVLFVIDHPNYDHIAAISGDVRAALAKDFD